MQKIKQWFRKIIQKEIQTYNNESIMALMDLLTIL